MIRSETMSGKEHRLTEVVARESRRLRNFIRARVPNEADVEDVLQDVFSELVEADALIDEIHHVSAWLFRVARNRIIDRFRRQRPGAPPVESPANDEGQGMFLDEWLPSPGGGPEAAYARSVLVEELAAALDELPPEQREVFVAHELEGVSFREMAQRTGLSLNTLLSRKRYAVLQLRERLRDIYLEYVTS